MLNRNFRYRNCPDMPCNSQGTPPTRPSGMGNGVSGATLQEIIKRLRKVDFALSDTILYLDAYPHCKAALESYKKLTSERHDLVKRLAESGYPMTAFSNLSDAWHWTDSPWPWEYEANV